MRSEQQFAKRLDEKKRLVETMNRLAGLIAKILQLSLEIEKQLAERKTETTQYAITDMRHQLDEMLGQDFLQSTTLEWLEQFPRYLQGILQRISKLGQSRDRDASATTIIARYWSMYRSVIDKEGGSSPSEQVIEFRWMIEELRVSLFAQQLGTKLPISEKRLQKAWDKVV